MYVTHLLNPVQKFQNKSSSRHLIIKSVYTNKPLKIFVDPRVNTNGNCYIFDNFSSFLSISFRKKKHHIPQSLTHSVLVPMKTLMFSTKILAYRCYAICYCHEEYIIYLNNILQYYILYVTSA